MTIDQKLTKELKEKEVPQVTYEIKINFFYREKPIVKELTITNEVKYKKSN
jgi:hypothetical protein